MCHRRSLLAGALLLALLPACQPAPPPPVDLAAAEAAVRERAESFNDYLTARNDSALAALYTSDGVLLPPGMPAVSGTDAIREFWAYLWPLNATLEITPGDIEVAGSGDLAVETGTWTFAATDSVGPFRDRGKYVVMWVRADSVWHADWDIWNSDLPAPERP